jgi:hypothetical protein
MMPSGAADVEEPIEVLVLLQLADELGAMSQQTDKDVLDIVDGEHDAAHAERVRRCELPGADRRRRVELRQLKPAVAVRRPHHGDVGPDFVESDDSVHPTPRDYGLAVQLQT